MGRQERLCDQEKSLRLHGPGPRGKRAPRSVVTLRGKLSSLAGLTPSPPQFLSEGYAAHLAALQASHRSRPKKNNSRMILRKGSFGLHAQPEFLRKRNHLRRTLSVQQPDPPAITPKPERAQSQPESDKDHERPLPALSWVRGPPKFESVP